MPAVRTGLKYAKTLRNCSRRSALISVSSLSASSWLVRNTGSWGVFPRNLLPPCLSAASMCSWCRVLQLGQAGKAAVLGCRDLIAAWNVSSPTLLKNEAVAQQLTQQYQSL